MSDLPAIASEAVARGLRQDNGAVESEMFLTHAQLHYAQLAKAYLELRKAVEEIATHKMAQCVEGTFVDLPTPAAKIAQRVLEQTK